MSEETQDNTEAMVDNTKAVGANTDAVREQVLSTAAAMTEAVRDNTKQFTTISDELRSYVLERTQWLQRISIGFVVVFVAVAVALWNGHQQTADIVRTRDESRVTACNDANAFIAQHNLLVDSVEQAVQIVAAPGETPRTPEQQAGVDAFVLQYTATIEQSRSTPRDCSTAGITAHYSGN